MVYSRVVIYAYADELCARDPIGLLSHVMSSHYISIPVGFVIRALLCVRKPELRASQCDQMGLLG